MWQMMHSFETKTMNVDEEFEEMVNKLKQKGGMDNKTTRFLCSIHLVHAHF